MSPLLVTLHNYQSAVISKCVKTLLQAVRRARTATSPTNVLCVQSKRIIAR